LAACFGSLVVLSFPFLSRFILPPWIMDESILLCLICPGQPQFSDASHLLTHAASKAHLSHHFKLRLRTGDPNADELLRQYDHWFETHNLTEKLAARMAKKEGRKNKKSGRASTSTTTENQAPSVEPEGSITPAANSVSTYLDPRLVDYYNEKEKKYATLTPTTPDRLPTMNSNERSGPVLRSMRSFNGNNSNALQPANVPGLDDKHRPLTLPVTPTQPPRHEATSDPFVESGNRTQASGDADMDKARADEISRLKGVLWPGMDVFDSATLQMRRRRNQKKDGTVLKQMEMTSLLAKPNELVFDPKGTLLKERLITGNVEEYSPLKGETPVPKRRMTRPPSNRLTRADPNVPRAMDRKRQRTAARNGRNGTEQRSVEEQALVRHPRRGADRTQAHGGIDEDYGLTYNPYGKRGRGRLNVFADGERGMQPIHHEQSLEHKGPVDTVTPTRLVLNGKTNSGIHSGIGAPIVAKENLEPILNSQGRIGAHGWNSSFASYPDPGGYDFGNSRYGLEGTYDGNGNPGHHLNHQFNPLQAPLQAPLQPPLQAPAKRSFWDIRSFHAKPYEEPAGTQDSWLSMEQIIPSEETIPEEDSIFSSCIFGADLK
jgi:hypothetical protein